MAPGCRTSARRDPRVSVCASGSQVTEERKAIKDPGVMVYLATLETRDQKVNEYCNAEYKTALLFDDLALRRPPVDVHIWACGSFHKL